MAEKSHHTDIVRQIKDVRYRENESNRELTPNEATYNMAAVDSYPFSANFVVIARSPSFGQRGNLVVRHFSG